MTPTLFGLYLMLAYPVCILAYDGVLKLTGRETISEDVWASSSRVRWAVCGYLATWCVGLVCHFAFGFLE